MTSLQTSSSPCSKKKRSRPNLSVDESTRDPDDDVRVYYSSSSADATNYKRDCPQRDDDNNRRRQRRTDEPSNKMSSQKFHQWTVHFSEPNVRRSNPDLDHEWNSCVVVPCSRRDDDNSCRDIATWDALADAMSCQSRASASKAALKRVQRVLELRKGGGGNAPVRMSVKKLQEEVLTLLLTGESLQLAPALIWTALHAGFFPFGIPIRPPPMTLQSSKKHENDERSAGLLALELGGLRREPPTAPAAGGGRGHEEVDGLDHGGRIVLTSLDRLVVGKRCYRTILDSTASPSESSKAAPAQTTTGKNRFPYRLTVSDHGNDIRSVWDLLVREHGIDWLGFDAVRYALLDPVASSQEQDVKESAQRKQQEESPTWISICLWDDGRSPVEEAGNPVSVELGYVVGRCYVCVSTHSRTADYPRCDQVRATAATCWLFQRGVRLIDVGVTASYYVHMLGFERTTRSEFLTLWRQWRNEGGEGGLALCGECRNLVGLLSTASSSPSTSPPSGAGNDPGAKAKPARSKPVVELRWPEPVRASEDAVRSGISSLGDVERVSLRRSGGRGRCEAAYVTFKEESSVKTALDAGHIVVCGSDAVIRPGPSG